MEEIQNSEQASLLDDEPSLPNLDSYTELQRRRELEHEENDEEIEKSLHSDVEFNQDLHFDQENTQRRQPPAVLSHKDGSD